jgi:ppGpp synthetase/RelA/SpoT-type nucleotidyltranferase
LLQATKLKHQLAYEKRRDLKAEVTAAQQELQQIEQNLKELEEQTQAATAAAERAEQELAADVRQIIIYISSLSTPVPL